MSLALLSAKLSTLADNIVIVSIALSAASTEQTRGGQQQVTTAVFNNDNDLSDVPLVKVPAGKQSCWFDVGR